MINIRNLPANFYYLSISFFFYGCALGWDRPPSENDGADTGDFRIEFGADTELDLPETDCPFGMAPCGRNGECVDIIKNHENCGNCGIQCEPFEVCSQAQCTFECPPGKTGCNGGCVDLLSDIDNCGTCGQKCEAGQNADPFCDTGICKVICHPGWSDNDGDGSCESNCVPRSSVEECNGIDDNCDGRADEGFDCQAGARVACTTTCSTTGYGTCSNSCTVPTPSQCQLPPETCNGIDDDCDGRCDNGFECCSGESSFCTTSCGTSGMKVCSSTCMWSGCIPPPETCNGSDDDCDGVCDNGYECCRGGFGSCTTSCGSQGTRQCSSSCQWQTCTPPPESCNGIDDDCDGVCDDGYECCAGQSGSCSTTCGSTGTRRCLSDCHWETCVPPAETCNGRDDNCDGNIDEPFWQYRCPSSGYTYSDRNTCNNNCFRTANCNLATISASGEVLIRDCSYGDYCWPYNFIGKITGSGNNLIIYNDYMSEIGRITINGASASGEVLIRDCSYGDSCWPSNYVGKITGSGNNIIIYNDYLSVIGSITINGASASGEILIRDCSYGDYCWPYNFIGKITGSGNNLIIYNDYMSEIGRITLNSTTYQCPLGSYSCSGSPPSCTAPQTCETITVCP